MAAASDKARFFLEQSVPELKEYERKKIFASTEITSITRQRSDFEHKINARGSTPADYARYAEFEINVDALRRKRVKRMGIKSTNHNGQRRIFFVFDRGTRKHPGDVGLWMQSIEYARKCRAHKKLTQILTSVLRLHPTKSDLWLYAAQFAMEEHADMTEARGYMQRGLRFCRNSRGKWIEYARLEMSYMAKIHARRQILGLDQVKSDSALQGLVSDSTRNLTEIPKLTAGDINPQVEDDEVDQEALHNLDATPALSGAIPMAIFDSAMLQFKDDTELGYAFFDMVAEYDQLQATPGILQHITDSLLGQSPRHWAAQSSHIRLAIFAISQSSPNFPSAFRDFLKRLKDARSQTKDDGKLLEIACNTLHQIADNEEIDPAIKTVAESVLRSMREIP